MRQRSGIRIPLDLHSKEPLTLQIVRGLATAIRNGVLKPGQPLPGSRVLAEHLEVHRNTVLAALRELEAEGWIETRQGSGTYVSSRLPDLAPQKWGPVDEGSPRPAEPGFDLPQGLNPITAPLVTELNMAEGLPDVRQVPSDALARGYQRAIRLHGEELLKYGEPRGNLSFRKLLVEMLRERRGLSLDADQILVTRGSRMALDLVCLALFRDGGVVAVEDPGQRSVWETVQQSAAVKILAVPVDGEGLRVDLLEEALRTEKVGLLYLTPHRQIPTTVPLSPARRMKLLELAQKHRMAILEDDSEGEFTYDGKPLLPLACGDPTGQVIYMSSLSRLLAPGIRLGFLAAPQALVDRLARVRVRMDWQGDRVLEWSMGDLIRDGDLARHLRKVRRLYQERRDLLAEGLARDLGSCLDFQVPDGGLALWIRGRQGFPFQQWLERCRTRGVLLHPGRHFSHSGRDLNATRLGFAAFEPAELQDALHRMRSAV